MNDDRLKGTFGIGELERRLQDLRDGKQLAPEERLADLRSQIEVVKPLDVLDAEFIGDDHEHDA